jgi:hypothetical protein
MQEEIAATLKIPFFIELKLAGDLVHFDDFTQLFRREKANPGAASAAVKLLRPHSIIANKQLFPNRRCRTDKQSKSLSGLMQIARLLNILTVLGAFCSPLNGALRAAENQRRIDIHVLANAFGTASSADITALLQSAANEIWRYCARTQLGGIDVYHRGDHPQTDFKRTPSGRIAIGLAAQNTHWAQYSFQFAHEFCHTLANYSNSPQRLMRYPPQANFWLEESLCEAASLFTLRAMSRSWRTAPPYPSWKDYAPWLNAYAQQRLTLPEHQLPAGKPFSVWFQENQPALRQNFAIRNWNTIIAIRLLPVFEAEPRGWEAVTFLNQGPRSANKSLAKHLADWRSHCQPNLRPFVAKIAAVFGVRL